MFVDKIQDDISSESGPSSSRGIVSQNCVFCNGRAGFLYKDDLKAKLTEKGLKAIIDVCRTRDDEPSKIILKNRYKTPSDFPWKFHKACRSDFIHPTKIATTKKRLVEDERRNTPSPVLPPKVLRSDSLFQWHNHCFICSEVEDRKKRKEIFIGGHESYRCKQYRSVGGKEAR